MISRCEVFDETDLDAAIERFEQLSRPSPRLENAASQVAERFLGYFASQQWDDMADILADGFYGDDRRPVVGSGVSSGRDAQIADLQTIAELWSGETLSTVLATRGARLALMRLEFLGGDPGLQAFVTEVLCIVETNSDGQTLAWVAFGSDDVDAAFAELDARYVAGEAVPYANTWSAITGCFAALSRHELPSTTPDLVDIDHRRGAAFAPGELLRYLRAGWEINEEVRPYVEAVHRLNNLGTVVTHAAQLTSREGFEAEWRTIDILTVDGDLIKRAELYDEVDLDAAIARFDELSRPAPRLENAAARVFEHVWSHYATRNWDAMAATVADSYCGIDHRRVVNAEAQHGREDVIRDLQAAADVGFAISMVNAVAIRGERLVLARVRAAGRDAETIQNDALNVVEVDADGRIATVVVYDLEDFDAAVAELEARYTAGEAAPYANTWSVISGTYASIGRHELPATTSDLVSIDHRRKRPSFASGELNEYIRAGFELNHHVHLYVETVHRLNDLGAVVTYAANGNSQEGFDAEWRDVTISAVEGNLISRCEFFDEVDLDLAIARFTGLSRPSERLENGASRAYERFQDCFAARDWDAMSDILAHNVIHDGRRRIVGAGLREGRAAFIAAMTALAGIGVTRIDAEIIATRGRNLVLSRSRASGRDERPEAFHTDVLNIVEIDAAGKFTAYITLDPEDFDAAITELDARYLDGEAAPHRRTWTVIAEAYARINRRELVATARTASISTIGGSRRSKRRSYCIHPSGVADPLDDFRTYIEAVHRLSDLGAVFTHVGHGTSREGFEAEWREVGRLLMRHDLFNRCERFDEADVEAAIARFEALQSEVPRLGNTASRALDRYLERVVARDWDAIADMLAADYYTDDRRHLVGGGIHGRDAEIASVQVQANLGVTHATPTVISVRGDRLALSRVRYSGHNQGLETFVAEMLVVFEIDEDGRFAAAVAFDLDCIDAAIAELDARYLVGEAETHARVWRAVAQVYTTLNNGEIPTTTHDFVDIDHRRLAAIGPGDLKAYLIAALDDATDAHLYVETVQMLTDRGAVVTHVAIGTSRNGFAADWRITGVYTVEGDLINRYEVFDDSDLDAALARFEELQRPSWKLKNAASRVAEGAQACLATEDWAALTAIVGEDIIVNDRRRVIGVGIHRGPDESVGNFRAASDIGFGNVTSTVIATRGERLLLDRLSYSGRDSALAPFSSEVLRVFEIDAEEKVTAVIVFDLEDIDAAYAELDARYLAGEAVPYADTWSTILEAYAAFNRHELPPTTADWVNIDHRRAPTIAPGDLAAHMRATRDVAPHIRRSIEAVHRLNSLGAVVTHTGYGTSPEGFDAEWRLVALLTFKGSLLSHVELFDESDLDTALAKFHEVDRPPLVENAASRMWARLVDALNRRDMDVLHALIGTHGRYEHRRKGLQDLLEGPERWKAVQAYLDTMPSSWLVEVETIAIRGSRLALARHRFRDVGDADRPTVIELLRVIELHEGGLDHDTVSFDADDINGAFAELTARWIASGEVDHPEIIELAQRLIENVNRHDWDAVATLTAGATHINHRQLSRQGVETMADHMTSVRMVASLVPDYWIEPAEILACSTNGSVAYEVVKGTTTDGVAIEVPLIHLGIFEPDHVVHVEAFDPAQRDLALARFEELSVKGPPR